MSNKLINPNCVSIYTHVYVYLDPGYMPIYSTRSREIDKPKLCPIYTHKLPVYPTNLHPYIRHNNEIIFYMRACLKKSLSRQLTIHVKSPVPDFDNTSTHSIITYLLLNNTIHTLTYTTHALFTLIFHFCSVAEESSGGR